MSSQPEGKGGFVRAIGLFPATALNMSQMVGIGPFITIPLILAVLTGPLAIVGWVVGALIAICDGLVWAELGAAMPTAGGSYVYLREGFQYYAGRFMPFMFVWSTLLELGVVGFGRHGLPEPVHPPTAVGTRRPRDRRRPGPAGH